MHKILLANIGSNLSVLLVRIGITFVMTPVYLRELGVHDYGVWEILAALIGYMGILDIGIKPAVGRYISKYIALEDDRSVREVFSTACVFMLAMGLASALLLLGFGYLWVTKIALVEDSNRYFLLLSIIAVNLVVQFPSLVIDSAFEGQQKYTLKNTLLVIKALLVASTVYYFIDMYDGLLVLAFVSAAGMVFKYIIGVMLLRLPYCGRLSFSLRDVKMRVFRQTLTFGFKSFVQGMASRIQIGSDRLVIGYFLGPALVPIYSIPANLIGYIRNLGWTITEVFMPLFSSLEARKEQEAMRAVYLTASRFCVGLMLPMSIGTMLVGGPFIGVWLGSEYQQDAEIIIQLLVLFTMLPLFNPFSTRYLTALGRHGLLAKLYPLAAVLNIILSVLLVHRYGLVGVALGSLLPMLIVVPVVLQRCCHYLGISVTEYVLGSIVPSLLPALTLVSVLGVYRYYTHLASYPELLLAVLIGVLSYAPVFFITGLQAEERNWVLARLRGGPGGKPVT